MRSAIPVKCALRSSDATSHPDDPLDPVTADLYARRLPAGAGDAHQLGAHPGRVGERVRACAPPGVQRRHGRLPRVGAGVLHHALLR